MAEIGSVCLVLALVASVYSAAAFIASEKGRYRVLAESARNGLLATCGLVSLSVVLLVAALLTHDFGIQYVVSYSSRSMSVPYLVSALWAGNDGSLLTMTWLLAVFSAVAVVRSWRRDRELVGYAAAVMAVTEAFLVLLLVSVADPFEQSVVAAAEGAGLNPLLENPAMIVHPPLLLGGYAGLTIPFAFAMSSLATGQPGIRWLTAVRGWAVAAWLFLGVGNIIGAWWAYVELGWGGYWSWDPVENAGLMPMLIITAFLHSSVAQRRTGRFYAWNLALVALAFFLAVFGTFLTRSGILSSVHTFTGTGLGGLFAGFLGAAVIAFLVMVVVRRSKLRNGTPAASMISREGTFLLTNVLFVGTTALVLLGTLFPLLSEVFAGTRIEVGESFYNRVAGPLFLVILGLVGICSFTRWQKRSVRPMFADMAAPLVVGLVAVAVLIGVGVRQAYAVTGLFVCAFAVSAVFIRWLGELRGRRNARRTGYLAAGIGLVRSAPGRYGGYMVHIGMVLIAVGVIGSSFYGSEREAVVSPGDTVVMGDYELIYEGTDRYETPDRLVVTARVAVESGGKSLGRLSPERYFHRTYKQPVSEVAIRTTLVEDLYVVLLGTDEDGTAALKVLVNPAVLWIWVGGGVLLVGGLVALWPRARHEGDMGSEDRGQ